MAEIDSIEYTPELLAKAAAAAASAAKKAAEAESDYSDAKDDLSDYMAFLKTEIEKELPDEKLSDTKLERLVQSRPEWTARRKEFYKIRRAHNTAEKEAKNKERTWRTIQSNMSYIKEGKKRDIIA